LLSYAQRRLGTKRSGDAGGSAHRGAAPRPGPKPRTSIAKKNGSPGYRDCRLLSNLTSSSSVISTPSSSLAPSFGVKKGMKAATSRRTRNGSQPAREPPQHRFTATQSQVASLDVGGTAQAVSATSRRGARVLCGTEHATDGHIRHACRTHSAATRAPRRRLPANPTLRAQVSCGSRLWVAVKRPPQSDVVPFGKSKTSLIRPLIRRLRISPQPETAMAALTREQPFANQPVRLISQFAINEEHSINSQIKEA